MKHITTFVLVASILLGACTKEQPVTPTLGSISGRTIDGRTLQPLASVQITTTPPSSSVVSGSDGTYTIPNVVPGAYVVDGRYTDSAVGQVSANVIAGLSTQADIVLDFDAKRPTTIPVNGLVAYYPLNGSGKDLSDNKFDGQAVGGTFVADRNGVASGAYQSVGRIDEGVVIPHNTDFNILPMSLAAWIRIDDASLADCLILGKNVQPNGDGYYFLLEGGQLVFVYVTNGFSNGYRVDVPVTANTWFHVAATVSDSAANIYVNGVATEMSGLGASVSRVTNLGEFRIGSTQVASGDFQGFIGTIDDVFVYNKFLTPSEVLVLKSITF